MIHIGSADYAAGLTMGALERPDCPDCTHGVGYHGSSGCTAVLDVDGADQHCLCRLSPEQVGAFIDEQENTK